jgi:starvation-inducible DNA-binding protein
MSQTIPVLQAVLVDLIDLGLQAKQAHWNVQGPAFRPVHLELDELVEQLLAWQDEVAERIAALGGHPDGRAATVAGASRVSGLEAGALRDTEVVRGFTAKVTAIAQAIGQVVASLDDDPASQDILVTMVAGLDKAAWFFRAQLA